MEPTKISLSEPEKLVGKYGIFYKDKMCVVGKIIRIEYEPKRKICYELITGEMKGKSFKSTFGNAETVEIYEEWNVISALCDDRVTHHGKKL
jgi:hypothetical protein